MSRHFEFRVLSGCHAGAVAPVHDAVRVGSDLDCDIVLADDGLPALPVQVQSGEAGFSVDGGSALDWNLPWQLGPVWVTVALPDQPWPAVPAAQANGMTQSDDDSQTLEDAASPDGDADLAPDGATLAGMDGQSAEDAASADAVRPGRRRRAVYAIPVLLGAAVISTLTLALWRVDFGAADTAVVVQTASVDTATAEQIRQIRQALEDLGQDDQIQVLAQEQGPVVLRGWVSTESHRNAIAQAMTRIWPMPALQLHVRNQVLGKVRAVVKTRLIYHQVGVQDQQIHIEGIAPDQKTKADVLALVAAQYPDIPVVSERLVLASEVYDRFVQALQEQGVADLTPEWDGSYLQLDVRGLPAADQQRVRQAVAGLSEDYWQRLKLLGLDSLAPALPFTIRSVVSGPQPYVVLANGSKLLLGGRYRGFRLTAIEAGRLVFQGDQELVVQR